IHQAYNDYYGTYRAMEEAYKSGKVRAIGVSNFYPDRFLDLAKFCEIKPAVNQLETHVFHQRKEIRKYLEEFGTRQVAWAPFARGENNLFINPVLVEIGKRYGKTAGQVALRFLTQNGIAVIPKSTHKERMAENINIFDFSLSQEELQKIELLDKGQTLFMNHQDPEAMQRFFARFAI
ncbi:MAG: aldo/keto reductase, partial [Mucilaginibacter sp.]